MNLPDMRQGPLDTGGEEGRRPSLITGQTKNPRGGSKLGKRSHSFRLQIMTTNKTPRGTRAVTAAVPSVCP